MNPQKLSYFLAILLTIQLSCKDQKREIIISLRNCSSTIPKVELDDLAKNLQLFDGKFVELEGEFSFYFEDVALYDDRLFTSKNFRIWLNFDVDMIKHENKLERLSGQPVVVRGKVNAKRKGHLGGYHAEIDSICYMRLR